MYDFFAAVFPIGLLIWLMTKRRAVPSWQALPLAAVLMYLVMLVWFRSDPAMVQATVIRGLLEAWTPILIIGGAVLLFRTMEATGAMDVIRQWLNSVTRNPVGQLMLIAWAFEYVIEGASGFGTPAALAGPILVGLGFTPVRVAIVCLVMNSVPVSFGAMGTPTWFGFGALGLDPDLIITIGIKSALIHAVAALVVPVIGLTLVLDWSTVRRNLVFVYISVLGCVLPALVLSFFSYEFPSIIGGSVGLLITAVAARYGWGLARSDSATGASDPAPSHAPPLGRLLIATFAMWGTVVVLILTRIKQLPFKAMLVDDTAWWTMPMGTLGSLEVSRALVIGLNDIAGMPVDWSLKLLYVPALIPFVLIAGVSFLLYRSSLGTVGSVVQATGRQLAMPVIALLGALVLVRLIMMTGIHPRFVEPAAIMPGDSEVTGRISVAQLLGALMGDLTGRWWELFAAYLGALGAFFAGSNTISNLTFGGIQDAIAKTQGLNRSTVLALQSVGGAMGNMVCINNIVAVCSVLGLAESEGFVLKRTVWPMLIYGLIAAVMAMLMGVAL